MVTSVQPTATEAIVAWLAGAGAVVEDLPDADLVRVAQLVRHGRGITLTGSAGVVAQIFRQPGLTAVPLRGGPRVELGLVWRADADVLPITGELRSRLTALVRDSTLRI
jgi:DNA-binding transcriptional LysR family regulator